VVEDNDPDTIIELAASEPPVPNNTTLPPIATVVAAKHPKVEHPML